MTFLSKDTEKKESVFLRAPRYFQPQVLKSFLDEASKLSYVSKAEPDHTVKLLDSFQPFYVEENPTGTQSLEAMIKRNRKFSTQEALDILASVLKSVNKAHKMSLIHGLIKPANILVRRKDGKSSALVVGYGFSEIQKMLAENKLITKKSAYTHGPIFDKAETSTQDDIYSCAVLGYQLLSRRLPVIAALQGISSRQYDSLKPSCPEVHDPKKLDLAFKRALMVAGEEPFDSAEEFLKVIEDIQSNLSAEAVEEEENEEKGASKEAEQTGNFEVPTESEVISAKLKNLTKTVESSKSEKIEEEKPAEALDSVESFELQNPEDLMKQLAQVDVSDDDISEDLFNKVIEDDEDDGQLPPNVGDLVLDRYVLLEALSQKEKTSVYVAQDLSVDRMVAIKILKSREPQVVSQFEEEIAKISKLEHKNIVDYIDFAKENGYCLYVMQHVDAPTLEQLLNEIKSVETEDQIASAAIQLCDALDYLHENGIFHGSISAENVMLYDGEEGAEIKVCGLGTGILNRSQALLNKEFDRSMYKNTGQLEAMMSSSQIDIYAATALVYQMTTGKLPFETSPTETLTNQDSVDDIESVTFLRSELFGVEKLDNLLKKGFDSTSEKFYKSVKELKDGIKSWIDSAYEDIDLNIKEEPEKEVIDKSEWLNEGEAKTIEQLQEEMRQNMELKANQVENESTFAMQFTKSASIGGRRKSPVRTIVEMIGLIFGSGVILFYTADYGVKNFDNIKELYISNSRKLSVAVYGNSNLDIASSDQIAFNYKDDPVYKRWTESKEVGETRRVLPDGQLKPKR